MFNCKVNTRLKILNINAYIQRARQSDIERKRQRQRDRETARQRDREREEDRERDRWRQIEIMKERNSNRKI